jgi:hypothetical protein
MLIKLSPDKLSESWPMVYRAIKSSSVALAEMTEERVNNVVRSLMIGDATCWIHEQGNTITTIVVTTLLEEPISKTRNLLIYCAHIFLKLKVEQYIEMSIDLGNYAKSLGCAKVIAYCSNDKLTEILKKSGANTLFTLVVFPLS